MNSDLRVTNISKGVVKIKFLPDTPRSVVTSVKNRLEARETVYIPSKLLKFVNRAYLDQCERTDQVSLMTVRRASVKTKVKKPKKSKSKGVKSVNMKSSVKSTKSGKKDKTEGGK